MKGEIKRIISRLSSSSNVSVARIGSSSRGGGSRSSRSRIAKLFSGGGALVGVVGQHAGGDGGVASLPRLVQRPPALVGQIARTRRPQLFAAALHVVATLPDEIAVPNGQTRLAALGGSGLPLAPGKESIHAVGARANRGIGPARVIKIPSTKKKHSEHKKKKNITTEKCISTLLPGKDHFQESGFAQTRPRQHASAWLLHEANAKDRFSIA
jgi:hypothetical protein